MGSGKKQLEEDIANGSNIARTGEQIFTLSSDGSLGAQTQQLGEGEPAAAASHPIDVQVSPAQNAANAEAEVPKKAELEQIETMKAKPAAAASHPIMDVQVSLAQNAANTEAEVPKTAELEQIETMEAKPAAAAASHPIMDVQVSPAQNTANTEAEVPKTAELEQIETMEAKPVAAASHPIMDVQVSLAQNAANTQSAAPKTAELERKDNVQVSQPLCDLGPPSALVDVGGAVWIDFPENYAGFGILATTVREQKPRKLPWHFVGAGEAGEQHTQPLPCVASLPEQSAPVQESIILTDPEELDRMWQFPEDPVATTETIEAPAEPVEATGNNGAAAPDQGPLEGPNMDVNGPPAGEAPTPETVEAPKEPVEATGNNGAAAPDQGPLEGPNMDVNGPPAGEAPTPETIEAPKEPVEATGNNGAAAPDQGPLEGPNMDVNGPPAGEAPTPDITQDFLKMYQPKISPEQEKVTMRQLFMEADLLVPGIALKKFKQALAEDENRSKSYIATLGVESFTMYKTSRPKLFGMMMGNFQEDPIKFWQSSSQHLVKPLGALFIFDNADMTVDDATLICLQLFLLYFRGAQQLTWTCSSSIFSKSQVLELMPVDTRLFEGGVRIFTVPSTDPLGDCDTTYGNVKIKHWKPQGYQDSCGSVKFASASKIGSLAGGLLHLADLRVKATKEDLIQHQKDRVSDQVEAKRPAALNHTALMIMLHVHVKKKKQVQGVVCYTGFTNFFLALQ